MGFFDSIGDWTGLVNTGLQAFNTVTQYNSAQDASALANRQFDTIAGSTAKQDAIADELFTRYKEKYWPLEDTQISQAKSWFDRYTPDIQDQEWANYKEELGMQPQYLDVQQGMLDQATMSPKQWGDMFAEKASSDVTSAFDNNRRSSERSLGRMGIDPTSGRSITALQSGMDVAKSLADVGGQSSALQSGYDTAWNRGAGALGFKMGNAIPQQSSVASGSPLAAMAVGGLSASNSANTNLMNTALKSAQGGSAGFSSSVSALLGSGQGSLQKGATSAKNLFGYQ